MNNEQRGVKCSEHNCKVGRKTRIEVSTKLDDIFNKPLHQLDNIIKDLKNEK